MMSHSSIPNCRMEDSPMMSTSSHSPLASRYCFEFLDISLKDRAGLSLTSRTVNKNNSVSRNVQQELLWTKFIS